MQKVILQCPKCSSNLIHVARDMQSTRHCGSCNHEWLPAAKNSWRFQHCNIKLLKNSNAYEFQIVFEDGNSVLTTIQQSTHTFEVLAAIRTMLMTWENGDHIVEPVLHDNIDDKDVKSTPPQDNDDKNFNDGLNVAIKIIDDIKNDLMKNNPLPNQISSARDTALMMLHFASNLIANQRPFELTNTSEPSPKA